MISVCMIMKNEEKFINECLKRIADKNMEIVIADTGSTDKSIEIAKKYTDKIYHFDWIDDFAAARNFSISKASNDIVFVLDCDEYVINGDFDKIEKVISESPNTMGYILRYSKFTRDGLDYISNEDVPRIFSKKHFGYKGTIHEQPVPFENVNSQQYYTNVTMDHAGYDTPEVMKVKAERNIRLLKREYEANNENTYVLYQLGKSYYAVNDYENAVLYFEKCDKLQPDRELTYVWDMYNTYAYALINSNRNEEALGLLKYYDELSFSADFVFVTGLIYINLGRLSEAINEFKKALTIKEAKIQGVNSYAANYNIGVIYECVGDSKTALSYYEKCGNYIPAIKGIERIKK